MLVEKLIQKGELSKDEYIQLLNNYTIEMKEQLRVEAARICRAHYGNKVYTRGLIEFTNYCKNNCYYCGINHDNKKVCRYRLTKEEILTCCESGYQLGFKTFVLQGGEDPYYTDDRLVDIVQTIRRRYPDCAITLSVGERSYESYKLLKEAGANRYLLRHETANEEHYNKLHPSEMFLKNRKECLYNLKKLGYQVGAGFMVGSPYQTMETLAEDLIFLKELEPQMVGIGPFLPHQETRFRSEPKGSEELTLLLLSIVRILLPKVLLPATTALGTLDENGRELGLLHGCNVLMPNLSPIHVRKSYSLYDNKICMGDEAAESLASLKKRVASVGFELAMERGDAMC